MSKSASKKEKEAFIRILKLGPTAPSIYEAKKNAALYFENVSDSSPNNEIDRLRTDLARTREITKVLMECITSVGSDGVKPWEVPMDHDALEEVRTEKNQMEARIRLLENEKNALSETLQSTLLSFKKKKEEWLKLHRKQTERIGDLEKDLCMQASGCLSMDEGDKDKTLPALYRIHSLEKERDGLRFTVANLCKKLYKFSDNLRMMKSEQDSLVQWAIAYEKDMECANAEHEKLIDRIRAQELMIETLHRERELMRKLLSHKPVGEESERLRIEIAATGRAQADRLLTSTEKHRVTVTKASGLKERMEKTMEVLHTDLPLQIFDDEVCVDEVVARMFFGGRN
jgi:hypothetical protein